MRKGGINLGGVDNVEGSHQAAAHDHPWLKQQ